MGRATEARRNPPLLSISVEAKAPCCFGPLRNVCAVQAVDADWFQPAMLRRLSFGRVGASDEEEEAARKTQLDDLRKRWQADNPDEKTSDADLTRFLLARNYNVEKAIALLVENKRWRAQLPSERTPHLQSILDRKLMGDVVAWSEDGSPVMLFDCRWGKMLEGMTEEEATLAHIFFCDETLEQMEERGVSQWVILCIGGPPPMAFARKLASILEAAYPERLKTVVIAPVPWAAQRVIEATLWFLPESTRSKFGVASSSGDVCQALQIDIKDLPPFLQDLEEYEKERTKLGVVVATELEDGSQQSLRRLEVPAREQVTIDISVAASVTSVEFATAVASHSWLPSLVVGTQNILLCVSFHSDDGSMEDVVLTGEDINENQMFEQSWVNSTSCAGKLTVTVDNSHSSRLGKSVQFSHVPRTRPT